MFIYVSNPAGFKSLLFASEYCKRWPLVKKRENCILCGFIPLPPNPADGTKDVFNLYNYRYSRDSRGNQFSFLALVCWPGSHINNKS